MINRNSISKVFVKALIFAGFLMFFLTGCVPANEYTPVTKTKKAGLYNITGWNSAHCYFPSSTKIGSCSGVDINAKVGYKLYVGGLRANCEPGGNWSTSRRILASGTLPPGMSFQDGSIIKGIPEKRGHWIVRIKVENLYCGGKSYYGLEQELRFHVTGSGKVRY